MKITKTSLIALFAFSLLWGSALAQKNGPIDFRPVVEKRLGAKKLKLENICPIDTSIVARRVFKDYGAMFIAASEVRFPSNCVFASEEEVSAFQGTVASRTATIGGRTIELQSAAMDALDKARAAAAKRKLTITPRGASAAKRSYADTFRIWKSRFDPALKHWTARGKIKPEDAELAAKMETTDQVAQVIEWEKDSIWFSTGFNRSIFSSVAAPGTSQHLSMLALDVAEFANKDVRAILNQHGWFQTIIDDTPHFTYLGLDESELPKRGLIAAEKEGFKFWIPNFER
ncbi:MAG: hypothetical protein IPM21_17870 [Acidobacteria bacterium]|nr:hypothetical protein [Acidobacteriota bacterium]